MYWGYILEHYASERRQLSGDVEMYEVQGAEGKRVAASESRHQVASPHAQSTKYMASMLCPARDFSRSAMAPLFSLPNELIISAISSKFPCREQQIRSLATLLSVCSFQAMGCPLDFQ
jgi:hypothetical protein